MTKKPLKRRTKVLWGVFAFLFLMTIVGAVSEELPTDANGLTVQEQIEMLEKQKAERAIQNPPAKDDKDRSVDACVYARETVKQNLKSPRSADFEGSCNRTTVRVSTNVYKVSGYVYAENSFGANLRSFYSCRAEFTGTTWKTNCDIE